MLLWDDPSPDALRFELLQPMIVELMVEEQDIDVGMDWWCCCILSLRWSPTTVGRSDGSLRIRLPLEGFVELKRAPFEV